MQRTIASLAFLIFTVSGFAQGTLDFNTLVPTKVDAPISGLGGKGAAGYTAQLFLVGGTSLTPILPSTTFRTDNPFYVVDPGIVTVPGTVPGENVVLRLYAWYGGLPGPIIAECSGQSNDITVTLGGGGAPPALLIGLHGFSVYSHLVIGDFTVANVSQVDCIPTPEPSTMALGILALGVMFIRRR